MRKERVDVMIQVRAAAFHSQHAAALAARNSLSTDSASARICWFVGDSVCC